MPACAEVNDAMQSITNVAYSSREQTEKHKQLGQSRQQKICKDVKCMLNKLVSRNPFTRGLNLRSMTSGKEAKKDANQDKA